MIHLTEGTLNVTRKVSLKLSPVPPVLMPIDVKGLVKSKFTKRKKKVGNLTTD